MSAVLDVGSTPMVRIFLDTNVYIVGVADPGSPEGVILRWAGWEGNLTHNAEVLISEDLIDQVARVGRRLRGKDWAGAIISRMWQLDFSFVLIEPDAVLALTEAGTLPREDITVYLTAHNGNASCFVSSNHELIKALAEQEQAFVCFTPSEFVARFC